MENQKEVWNKIAKGWNSFKRKAFPENIVKLSESWKAGKILDLGCGNGRNLIPFAKRNFDCYCVDFSEEMIKNSKSYFKKEKLKANFKIGDLTKIPFEDGFFDYIICVAAFHHLDKKMQVKCLNEIKRVLKPNGVVYLSVWNKWQTKFIFSKKEKFIDWKTKDNVLERYYYLFNIFELKNLLIKNGFKIKKIFGIFSKNIETIFKI